MSGSFPTGGRRAGKMPTWRGPVKVDRDGEIPCSSLTCAPAGGNIPPNSSPHPLRVAPWFAPPASVSQHTCPPGAVPGGSVRDGLPTRRSRMRFKLKLAVLAAVVVGMAYLGTAAAKDDDIKDIKGCMAFQGKVRKDVPDLLKAKDPNWEEVQKETKD